jgi:ABC-type transport system involved in multi-copper enzyme maturation permease subunit
MLWYKSWLETRWRFLIGFAILMLSAMGCVFGYPRVIRLLPAAASIDASGEIGRRIREAVEISATYRGYVWSQWFGQELVQMWTIFAALVGSGSVFSRVSGDAAAFTLSLPASRNRVLGIRAATGFIELAALAFVPSLIIPLFSPAIGQSYSLGDALVYSFCTFVAGSAFYCLALLLSTVFNDLWRPLLLTCGVAIVMALGEQLFRSGAAGGIFHVMRAETYFRTGALPWLGLLVSMALSSAMLYGAATNIARRDF